MPSLSSALRGNTGKVAASVVVTGHDRGHSLERCVHGIVERSFRDWELIVLGDGSSTGSFEAARRFLTLPGEQEASLVTTRHEGFEGDPSLTVVGSPVRESGPAGRQWENLPHSFKMLSARSLIGSGAMFRREVWHKVGGYDEEMSGYADWDCWITLGETGHSMKWLDEILWYDGANRNAAYDPDSGDRDLELRVQVIRNHPGVYNDWCLRLTERASIGGVTDAEVLPCPHLIFSGSARAEAVIRRGAAGAERHAGG